MSQQPDICSCCGQIIPPKGLRLPRIKRAIYDAVQKRPGISAEALRSLIWDGPDGGPECRHTIFVHVAQLNNLLRPHGLCVRSEGGGYRFRSVS